MDHKKEIDELVTLVIQEGASDLHLSVGRSPVIRVSGNLIPLVKKPVITEADMKGYLNLFLSAANKELLDLEKTVDFSYNLTDARFRGNIFFHQGRMSVALRLIPKAIRTLSELNLPPILELFTRKSQGFFLCVGPIGQGKTTTLATLIEIINQTRVEHILTIEDPKDNNVESTIGYDLVKKWMIAAYQTVYENISLTSLVTKPLHEHGFFTICVESDEIEIPEQYLYDSIEYHFNLNENVIYAQITGSKKPITNL
jgi:hypothetical protein